MKLQLSKIAIFITLVVCIAIDFNLKNWENQDKVVKDDIHMYYGYLPAKFIYNDIKIEKSDYQYGENQYYFWLTTLPNGKSAFKMTYCLALLYSPFFFVAHFIANLFDYPTTGYSTPYMFFLLLSSLFYLYVGLFYMKKILSFLKFNDLHSAITILLIGIGTNLLCYSSQSAPLSHVYSFCLIAMFIFYTMLWYESHKIKYFIATSVLIGLISLLRLTDGIIYLFFITYGMQNLSEIRNKKFSIPELFILIASVFIVWLPQFIYWETTTGNPLVFHYGNEQFFFSNPIIYKGLLSFRKGWLIYTPMMFFAIFGLFLLKNHLAKLRIPILLFLILNIYLIFSWWCWWYGGSFGQRAMINSYAVMSIPLAAFVKYIFEKKGVFKVSFSIIALFFIWLNIFQTFQFENKSLHYEGMTQELYFKQFGKMDKIDNFDSYVSWIDTEKAKRGDR